LIKDLNKPEKAEGALLSFTENILLKLGAPSFPSTKPPFGI